MKPKQGVSGVSAGPHFRSGRNGGWRWVELTGSPRTRPGREDKGHERDAGRKPVRADFRAVGLRGWGLPFPGQSGGGAHAPSARPRPPRRARPAPTHGSERTRADDRNGGWGERRGGGGKRRSLEVPRVRVRGCFTSPSPPPLVQALGLRRAPVEKTWSVQLNKGNGGHTKSSLLGQCCRRGDWETFPKMADSANAGAGRAGQGRAGRGVRSRRPAAATGRGGGADCPHGGCAGGRRARKGEGNPGCGGLRRGGRSTGGGRLRMRPLELGDPGREHVSLASLQSNSSPPPTPRHFHLNCHYLIDPN